jgi:hypothetical protein
MEISVTALVVWCAVCVGSACASVVAGNDVAPRSETDTFRNFHIVDTNNPFNENGLVTQWEIYANDTLPVELVLYRNNGGAFSVIGRSGLETPVLGFNQFSLASPVAVELGDFVGVYVQDTGVVAYTLDPPFSNNLGDLSGTVLFTASDTGLAHVTDFIDSTNRTYSVRATGVVPEPACVTIWSLFALALAGACCCGRRMR